MRIARIRIENFRAIKSAEFFPSAQNVFLGPNNIGKTAVLEALNLLFNPELPIRGHVIDENDFYGRAYRVTPTSNASSTAASETPAEVADNQPGTGTSGDGTGDAVQQSTTEPPVDELPAITIQAVLTNLSPEDEDFFRDLLIGWKAESHETIDTADEGADPFAGASPAIRVGFEGRYEPDEDDFTWRTFFITDSRVENADQPDFTRKHKRQIGFLIYRDFRALTRPITLEPATLFGRLLSSQDVVPKQFDTVLSDLTGILQPLTSDPDFASILNSYKAELERFLLLSPEGPESLSFEITDRTRSELKEAAQLYVGSDPKLPLQTMGAGTRSLAILAILTLIMRRRQRGILALEEPETFLFPHAQRRVVDECIELADQIFVTTHSPYVLERVPAEGVGRLDRTAGGIVSWHALDFSNVKHLNLYSKRLRQSFCEALLGKGVVVVEGDSDKWWMYGASRIMNRKKWNERRQEALELQGISIVSTDSNADLVKTGAFFHSAGLRVVCIADQVKDVAVVGELCKSPFSSIFLRQAGLEDVLASQLPISVVRNALQSAPHSRVPLFTTSAVAAYDEEAARKAFCDFMIGNKGSGALHEWLLSQLDENTLPTVFKDLIDIVSQLVDGTIEPRRCSLM